MNKTLSDWKVWPTHWAGGSSAVQVDGENTIWVDSDAGEICRFKTDKGRITAKMYRLAGLIARLPKAIELLRGVAHGVYNQGNIKDFIKEIDKLVE